MHHTHTFVHHTTDVKPMCSLKEKRALGWKKDKKRKERAKEWDRKEIWKRSKGSDRRKHDGQREREKNWIAILREARDVRFCDVEIRKDKEEKRRVRERSRDRDRKVEDSGSDEEDRGRKTVKKRKKKKKKSKNKKNKNRMDVVMDDLLNFDADNTTTAQSKVYHSHYKQTFT
eukprot:67869_1